MVCSVYNITAQNFICECFSSGLVSYNPIFTILTILSRFPVEEKREKVYGFAQLFPERWTWRCFRVYVMDPKYQAFVGKVALITRWKNVWNRLYNVKSTSKKDWNADIINVTFRALKQFWDYVVNLINHHSTLTWRWATLEYVVNLVNRIFQLWVTVSVNQRWGKIAGEIDVTYSTMNVRYMDVWLLTLNQRL